MLLSALSLALAAVVAADTVHYDVLNHGRRAGAMRVVTSGDSVFLTFGYIDRQRGPNIEASYILAPDGTLRERVVRTGDRIAGTPPRETERLTLADGRLVWRARRDSGSVASTSGAWHLSATSHPYELGLLARRLLASPGATRPIAQGGTARASVIVDTTLELSGQRQRARLVELDVASTSPEHVWLDGEGTVLASSADWFITIRRGRESLLPALRAIERAHTARVSAALAARLAPAASRALVIRDVDLFDSERGVIVPRQTIVIDGERIAAVGPSASTAVPRGATVLDGRGKTVIPGLWDMHTHFFSESEASSGLLHLASGVTTVRDLAADTDDAVSARARAANGSLLYPRMLLGGFLEGPGAWAGPSDVLVRTEAEAVAAIARYDSLGYRQIKLYNLVHPDLVPTIVAESRRRGLRVSGHIPRGLTVENALALGFDEVQHAAFLMSTFYQDSLYVPGMRAYSSVAQAVVGTFDTDAARVTALIAAFKARGASMDPTLNVYQGSAALPDGTHPVFGTAVTWMPPTLRRASAPTPADSTVSKSRATYGRLVQRLWAAGVPVVPGTDNLAGIALLGELEAYERAGIPAAAVLQMATITSARVMGESRDYGSVSVGKVADLVVVDGAPATRVSDLRRAEVVVRAGRSYRVRALLEAAGFTSPSR
jgi:imidazolonepropionase-like amidohydrolase